MQFPNLTPGWWNQFKEHFYQPMTKWRMMSCLTWMLLITAAAGAISGILGLVVVTLFLLLALNYIEVSESREASTDDSGDQG